MMHWACSTWGTSIWHKIVNLWVLLLIKINQTYMIFSITLNYCWVNMNDSASRLLRVIFILIENNGGRHLRVPSYNTDLNNYSVYIGYIWLFELGLCIANWDQGSQWADGSAVGTHSLQKTPGNNLSFRRIAGGLKNI